MSVTGEQYEEACAEAAKRGRKEAVDAIIDHLRHTASGYALLRSLKMGYASDALYEMAEKLESRWEEIVLPRVSQAPSQSEKR